MVKKSVKFVIGISEVVFGVINILAKNMNRLEAHGITGPLALRRHEGTVVQCGMFFGKHLTR